MHLLCISPIAGLFLLDLRCESFFLNLSYKNVFLPLSVSHGYTHPNRAY